MSGGILGFLRVNLAMDSAQFGAGAKSARRDLAAIGSAAKATGVAVAAFGAALGAFSLKTAGAAVEMQGLARGANASMAEFQRATGAARSVGVEQEKLGDILRDVNDRIGDFITTGGGPMADFFEKIAPKVGVTAEQFAKLSGPDALQLYVSSLEQAGVGQKEMIFYLEAMSSDATKLLPLLADGGAEMKRLGDEAARYGLLTEQTAASGRNMRDAMSTLAAATTAVGAALVDSGIVDAMAEFVRAAADFIGLKVAPALRDMGAAMKVAFAETAPLGQALGLLTDNMDRIAIYAATAAAIFGGKLAVGLALAAARVVAVAGGLRLLRGALIRTGIGALIVGAGELVYQFTKLAKGAGGFGAALGLLSDVASEVWERIKTGAGAIVPVMKSTWALIEVAWLSGLQLIQDGWAVFLHSVADGLQDVPGMAKAFVAIRFAAIDAGTAFNETGVAISAARVRAAAFSAEAKEMAGASTAPLASLAALKEAMANTSDETDAATDAADRLGDALKRLPVAPAGGGGAQKTIITPIRDEVDATSDSVSALAGDLKTTLGSGLSRAFDGLISGGMKFRDILGSIMSDLAKMAMNRMITQLLDQVIGAAIGSFTSAAPMTSPIPVSRPAFASGTQFAPGGMALVGERGPEMVNLPQGSRVTPNHQLGGLSQIINVDARGSTDPAAVEAAVRRVVPSIAAATSRVTVTDMLRRGEIR